MGEELVSAFCKELFNQFPWISGVAVAAILIWLGVAILRSRNATEYSVFWGLYSWRKDAKSRELEDVIDKLNADSCIKENALFLSKLCLRRLADAMSEPFSAEELKTGFIEVLASLPSLIRSKSTHRCSVLLPEGEWLRPLYGHGYSDEGIKHMRLPINNSCAGVAFRNAEVYYCVDKRNDPHWISLPNARHNYGSIVCIPIKASGKVLGVLSVDAVEPNAFEKDDIDRLQLFTYQLAILLKLRDIMVQREEREVASS